MRNSRLIFMTLMLTGIMASTWAQDIPKFSSEDINIPYKRFTLDNGLTLLVHEDHKAPIVAINVWYHVGSKNEKPGKSGFAHLFEHLMFNGSEHFNDDYFQALESIGATDLNGTTNTDRTNYFQNVPTVALDQVLWLESDRMGHLLGAIDQAKLDEQRGVVQNEKRQGENQPYGRQWEIITHEMYPKGHPYSWTVIGSMDDLNAASLEDVHDWFKAYYGAANAVVVLAGDITPEDAYNKVNKYFGNIPSGPTIVRPEVNIPRRTSDTRTSYQDRVPESRITMVWNTPQTLSKEDAHLNLVSSILSSGKNSRLYKKLIYEDQSASSVAAFHWDKEISGNFVVQANVKPGHSVAEVEETVNSILAEFIKNGPTQQELERAKAQFFSGYIKGLERIGGFGGKSDILASSMVYGNDPEAYKEYAKIIENSSVEDLHNTAKEWLNSGKFTLVCNPFPEYTVTGEEPDRSSLPQLAEAKTTRFPDMEKFTLKNGMEVVLARRQGVPTVVMNMAFDAGYAADQFGKPGTASLAMNMIDEGTESLSSLEINERLSLLGASLGTGSSLDMSYVTMNTLLPSLDASLDLFADVIQKPAFPANEFARLKNEQLAQIQREKATPVQMAMRVMPKFLYGEDHAYGIPLTGSGYEATVSSLERADVVNFYDQWIRPNNATLIVVGDITKAELQAKLEKKFASWEKGRTLEKKLSTVDAKKGNTLYILDRPESQQSVIIAGYLVDPYGDVDEVALSSMNNVLGGQFISRLNMNLREDKHWAYGAGSFIPDAKAQRAYMAYAPVQTDKTAESILEIKKEFDQIVGMKPITKEEFEKDQKNTVLQIPGMWETNSAVSGSVLESVTYDLPDDYWQKYGDKVNSLMLEDVNTMAKKMVHTEKLNWFVVGDKEKIIESLKELGFDEIIQVDADGKPIQKLNTVLKP